MGMEGTKPNISEQGKVYKMGGWTGETYAWVHSDRRTQERSDVS